MPLQRYLLNMNRRQGLGVRLFKVVIDKPMLVQMAAAIGSIGSTLAVALYELGRANDGTALAAVCSMNSAQRAQLWQAMTEIMTPTDGVNLTCSYEELALPGFGLEL